MGGDAYQVPAPGLDEARRWLAGERSLAELRGYSEAELGAIAELGYALFRERKYDLATVVFQGLAALTGQEYPQRALAAIAVATRRYDEALGLLGGLIERHPASLTPRLLRAEVLVRQGRYAEAAVDASWVVQAAPRDGDEDAVRRRAAVLRRHLIRPGR